MSKRDIDWNALIEKRRNLTAIRALAKEYHVDADWLSLQLRLRMPDHREVEKEIRRRSAEALPKRPRVNLEPTYSNTLAEQWLKKPWREDA